MVVQLWRGHVERCTVHMECYAILSLQSLFRGHLVRKGTGSSPLLSKKLPLLTAKVTAARHRIRAATAAATEEMKIGNRNRVALQQLLTSKALSSCIKACHELQVATRLSDICCFKLCQNGAVPSLFELIHSCNRSKPNAALVRVALEILYNLSQHEQCLSAIYTAGDSVIDILVDQIQHFRENEQVLLCIIDIMQAISRHPAGIRSVNFDGEDVLRRLDSVVHVLTRQRKAAVASAAKKTAKIETPRSLAAGLDKENLGNIRPETPRSVTAKTAATKKPQEAARSGFDELCRLQQNLTHIIM